MTNEAVVGVDGSVWATQAVRWTAVEADRRGASLRLVSVRGDVAAVETALVAGHPVAVLREQSADAPLLGSVSTTFLRRSLCPVAVARV